MQLHLAVVSVIRYAEIAVYRPRNWTLYSEIMRQQDAVNSYIYSFWLPPYKIGHQAQKHAVVIC